jgi:hypothetical protein
LKRVILLMVVTAISVLALAVPAFAQGKVEQGTEHAKSVCSFSGLNDTPDAADPEGGRVQSYGQLVRQGLKADFPSPGVACNPTNTPPPEE